MKLLFSAVLHRVCKPALISLLFTASLPTTALALNKDQAVKGCLDGTLSQQERSELLLDMETWTTVFSSFVEENAGVCFTKLTGQTAEFLNNSGFITGEAALTALEDARNLVALEEQAKREARTAAAEALAAARAAAKEPVRLRICEIRELVTQYDKTINEAEAARQDRRIETLSATVQECSSWYDDSPKEALTNDICNSIFAAGGLPNSTISGPSQSEVLLAELSKQRAEQELRIIVMSGMLLGEYMATSQPTAEETDEEDQCNE